MTRQTIGAFLATQRKAHGYTQEEVADKLGISNRTLSKWETDRSSPDILYLPALADLYGVTVDEILRGERTKREEIPLSPEEQAKKEEQAQRAKRALQRRRLASFSAKTYIAYGVAAGGLLLVLIAAFLCTLPDGKIASFVLLAAGAAAYVAAAVLLLALRAGLADAAEDPRFALAAEQKFFRALRVILTCLLAESALCFLLLLAGSNNRLGGTLTAGILLLCAMTAYALTAGIEARRAATMAEGAAQRDARHDKKLAALLFSVGGAVMAAVLIAAAVLSSAYPTMDTPLVSGSADEVLAHMHTLVWKEEYNARFDADIPAGDYALDLSGIREEEPTPVGGGFTAQKAGSEVWIFPEGEGADDPFGVQTSVLYAPLLGETADGREVYNVRYGIAPDGTVGMVSTSLPFEEGYRLTEEGKTCTVSRVRVYSLENAACTVCIAAEWVGFALLLVLWNGLRSRRKFAL